MLQVPRLLVEDAPVGPLKRPVSRPLPLLTCITRLTSVKDTKSINTVGKISARMPISNGIAIPNQSEPYIRNDNFSYV